MRALTVGGIVVFALVAAFALTRAVGQRHPGQTITGNKQSASGADHGSRSRPGAGGRGQGESEELRGATSRTRATSSRSRDFTDAIHEFGTAARLDPSQPEPPTYAGWAGALLAQQISDPEGAPDPALGVTRPHQRGDQGPSEIP